MRNYKRIYRAIHLASINLGGKRGPVNMRRIRRIASENDWCETDTKLTTKVCLAAIKKGK